MKLYLSLKKQFHNFFFIFFFLILSAFPSNSNINDFIKVIGNKNISLKTIISLAPTNIKNLNPDEINEYQKKLFSTGFFEYVSINLNDKKLFISVKENPLVNFFYLEGINKPNLNEKILNIIKLKENTVFQSYLVKNDLKNISKYLNDIGYLNNKITHQLIKLDENKINVFYKIKLNNQFKINRIFFTGDKYFKSSDLRDAIFSSEYGWWKFLSSSTIPSESAINFDISKLKNFYLDNGFLDIQITSHSIKIINEEYANITYSLNAGKKYFIENISLIDNSKSINKENIEYLNKKYKKFFQKLYANSLVQNLNFLTMNYLESNNYNLNINTNIKKTNDNKIQLYFILNNQTNKKNINKIIIVGNNITDEKVIRNNLLFSEGDIFNKLKLNSSVEKLKGKRIFKNIESDVIENQNNQIDLKISVEEQPTGDISAGAGAGTSGATVFAGVNERNFLGKGIGLFSNFSLGTQKILGSITYSDPDFRNSGNVLNMNAFVQNNEFENTGYKNKIIGSSVSSSFEIFDKIFLSPGLSIDFDDVTANDDASLAIQKREGSYFTSKIFYNIKKNTLNRDFNPTRGSVFGVGQGLSIISDIPYISNQVFGSHYDEYMPNFVGSIRYQLESINGFSKDIKFSDRLFVSSNNLRGFANMGIGPKINNDFVGGNYSFYTSLSSTLPNGLPEKWNAITNVFLDTANVWGVDDKSINDSNKLRSSTGVGLSWISPLGPISFVYAVPILKDTNDDVENFNFKIGTAF